MAKAEYILVSARDRADLREVSSRIAVASWPEFMLHDPVAEHIDELYRALPDFQFGLIEPGNKDIIAIGNSVPLAWEGQPDDLPDEGWDWALTKGIQDHKDNRQPTVLCAIQIMVSPAYRSRGLSARMVKAMKAVGKAHGLSILIAPVRPNQKSDYPLMTMACYVRWQTDDGLPFDHWMRVHVRQGAEIIKVCPKSMLITGTVAEWEEWTKMAFPQSGAYIVPGALVPVEIDREADLETYIEPNMDAACGRRLKDTTFHEQPV